VKDIYQLLSRLGARGRAFLGRVDHVFADMALEHLRHQGVDGTPRGCDEVKNLGAVIAGLDPAFDGLDLSSQSSNTAEQLFVVSSVCHPLDISYPGRVCGTGPS
jgi:hypothetical protein